MNADPRTSLIYKNGKNIFIDKNNKMYTGSKKDVMAIYYNLDPELNMLQKKKYDNIYNRIVKVGFSKQLARRKALLKTLLIEEKSNSFKSFDKKRNKHAKIKGGITRHVKNKYSNKEKYEYYKNRVNNPNLTKGQINYAKKRMLELL